jgi:hypothetical protein
VPDAVPLRSITVSSRRCRVEGEHPVDVDARIDRAGVEEFFPLWSVAWNVDLEQGLSEFRFRVAVDVDGNAGGRAGSGVSVA